MLWPLCSIKESRGSLLLLWGQVAVFMFVTHTRMRKRRGANCADSTERHCTGRLESWSYHKSVQKLSPTKVYIYRFAPKTAKSSIFNRLHLNKESHARKHFLFLAAFSNKSHKKAFYSTNSVNSTVVCKPCRGLCYKKYPSLVWSISHIYPGNLQLIRVQFPLLFNSLGCTSVWIRILNVFWLRHCPLRFREIKTEKHSVSLRVSHTTKVSFFFFSSTHPALSDQCWPASCPSWQRPLEKKKQGHSLETKREKQKN